MRFGIFPFMILLISFGNPIDAFAQDNCDPLAAATAEEVNAAPRELLVLLRADAPAADEVVRGINQRWSLPGDLAAGQPSRADFLINDRATGKLLEQLQQDPDSPRARLERWIVLSYPEGVDLEAVKRALEADPHVETVEENARGSFTVEAPSNALFSDLTLVDPASANPQPAAQLAQWPLDVLDLPEAWAWNRGNAFVGLIDTGLDVDHPDLQTFTTGPTPVYLGGNFRPHLSWDFANPSSCTTNPNGCVDEGEEGGLGSCHAKGHGTHVSGIVAANANGDGIDGTCQGCSLMMARSTLTVSQVAAVIPWLTDHGVQIVSMSFGWPTVYTSITDAIAYANEHDVILSAAVGNDLSDIEFPASDTRVIAAGGIEPGATPGSAQFWQRDTCPSTWGTLQFCPGVFGSFPGTIECGSNYTVTSGSAMQELALPAADVISTFYVGGEWNTPLGCGDSNHPAIGYGLCTGTSMSSPHAAGLAGLVRSVNPLISQQDVRSILIANASGGGVWNAQLGYGVPDAESSVQAALGTVAGTVIPNRLTPLFTLYSTDAEAHLSTTVPQMAVAALLDPETPFISPLNRPTVGGYPRFPGTFCNVGPCIDTPRASVYLFTGHRAPFVGAPPLVPLYRMSFDGPWNGNPLNRSFVYTTEPAGLANFRNVGYNLDGIEGYIYQRCTPEPSCIPAGAVRLYRLYNFDLDDYAIFPETELANYQAAGYVSQPGLNDWIGYVHPNVDSDSDFVINGFEGLIGTNSTDSDSDDDGLSDGQEVLEYPSSDPLCNTVFAGSFDSGSTTGWGSYTAGGGTLTVSTQAALEGPYGLFATVGGNPSNVAFVVDLSPTSETRYRASFLYNSVTSSTLGSGEQHVILAAGGDLPNTMVILLTVRRPAGASSTTREFSISTKLNNGTWAQTSWFQAANVPGKITIEWWAAIGSQPGGLKFYLDNVLKQQLSGLANSTWRIERTRLGIVSGVGPGTTGSFAFDEFTSCRN